MPSILNSWTKYNRETGEFQLTFSKPYEKPPVQQLRCKLDEIQASILSACTQDTRGDYVVRQPRSLDPDTLNVINLIGMYETADHPVSVYYQLAAESPVVELDGKSYHPGECIDFDTLQRLEAAHPEITNLTCKLEPEFAVIEPETMQQVIDQLECAPKRAAALN